MPCSGIGAAIERTITPTAQILADDGEQMRYRTGRNGRRCGPWASLHAALEAGVPCGGWCPAGCLAEDGVIEERYGLRPLPRGGYADLTRRNVADSDATLVLYFGCLEGGTALTADYCRRRSKPLLRIDALRASPEVAAARARDFILAYKIETLNVAGPRASTIPAAHGYARKTLSRLLEGFAQDVE
jgi:hypothetical protein